MTRCAKCSKNRLIKKSCVVNKTDDYLGQDKKSAWYICITRVNTLFLWIRSQVCHIQKSCNKLIFSRSIEQSAPNSNTPKWYSFRNLFSSFEPTQHDLSHVPNKCFVLCTLLVLYALFYSKRVELQHEFCQLRCKPACPSRNLHSFHMVREGIVVWRQRGAIWEICVADLIAADWANLPHNA